MRVLAGAAILLVVPLTALGATSQPGTTLVSVVRGGGWANGHSYGAKISSDGRLVAFWSSATNVTARTDALTAASAPVPGVEAQSFRL